MLPKYSRDIGGRLIVFLSGADCFALRCAYLHEGTDTTVNQRARDALSRIRFYAPKDDGTEAPHANRVNDQLQLAVRTFCRDMIDGAKRWLAEVGDEPLVQEKMKQFLVVLSSEQGVVFGQTGFMGT